MKPDLLATLVADALVAPLPAVTAREIPSPAHPHKASAFIGMRRSGKTFALFDQAARLLAAGLPRHRLLYLDLEDDRFEGATLEDLGRVPDIWAARHPDILGAERWLLLDEVQVVDGWERFVRRLLDAGGWQVLVSGSSARLLSSEIATSLRGRAWSTEVLPFSFREALAHRGLAVPAPWPPAAADRAVLRNAFDAWLVAGGFPEAQGLDPATRGRLLHGYVDVVLFRDVVERHQVTNVAVLRGLVRRLLAAPAGRFSVHRLYNDLRSQGFAVGKDTLYAMMGYLESAFLVFTVPMHADSERVRASNPHTVYLVDPGLARSPGIQGVGQGHLLENAVYLELRRRGWSLSWVRTASGREVDLLATAPGRDPLLVQVCAWMNDPDTRRREIAGLVEAMEELGTRDALVITLEEEGEVREGGHVIPIRAAMGWFVEGGGG